MKSHDMAYVACFLIGFVMLALGIGGFISLGMIVKDWNPARGVVERIESERVYKYRKMRWEHRVDVRYETVEFGEMYTSKEVYLTFGIREGGEIALLYNPEYVRKEGRLPCFTIRNMCARYVSPCTKAACTGSSARSDWASHG